MELKLPKVVCLCEKAGVTCEKAGVTWEMVPCLLKNVVMMGCASVKATQCEFSENGG